MRLTASIESPFTRSGRTRRCRQSVMMGTRTHWLGNWHADRLAKQLVVQVDCSEETRRHLHLKQLAELAGLQGEAMALGECLDTPPWPEEWEKMPK
eukprot:4688046-Amphidinium_carterae.1